MNCPNSQSGCSCPSCHKGLLDYCRDSAHHADLERYLDTLRDDPIILRVVTLGPDLHETPPCNGTLTCPCATCDQERAARRPQKIRQPWVARPARNREQAA